MDQDLGQRPVSDAWNDVAELVLARFQALATTGAPHSMLLPPFPAQVFSSLKDRWPSQNLEKIEPPQGPLPAWWPLKDRLKSLLQNRSRRERLRLLAAQGIYRPLRGLFKREFSDEPVPVLEPIPYQEKDYHRGKILDSLCSLLSALKNDSPEVLWFHEPERLPFSTLSWLTYCLETSPPVPVLCVFETDQTVWETLDSCKKDLLNRLLACSESLSGPWLDRVSPQPLPSFELNFDELVHWVEQALDWQALEDAQDLLPFLENRRSLNLTPQRKFQIDRLQAELAFWKAQHDKALVLYHRLLTTAPGTDAERAFFALRISQSYFHKSSTTDARAAAALAHQLALQSQDKHLILQTLAASLEIDDKENTLPQDEWKRSYLLVLKLMQELGWENNLSYWLIRPDRFDPQVDALLMQDYLDRAWRLRSGNQIRAAATLHAQGLLCIYRNDYATAKVYYRKAERLFRRLGNQQTLAQIQNGFGYLCYQSGEAQLAEVFFYKAFRSAFQARDFHETAMAVANIAINYLFGRHFDQAAFLLEDLLKLLQASGIANLPYHTQFGLQGLLALAVYPTASAREFSQKILQLKKLKEDRRHETRRQNLIEEDLVWELLQAYQALLEENPTQAEMHFINAETRAESSLVQYLAPFFYWEHALACCRRNDLNSCQALHLKAQQAAFRARLTLWRDYLDRPFAELVSAGPLFKRRRKRPDFVLVHEAVQVSRTVLELHQRIQQLDFLTTLQSMTVQAASAEMILDQAHILVKANFSVDIFILLDADSGEVFFQRGLPENGDPQAAQLLRFLSSLSVSSEVFLGPEAAMPRPADLAKALSLTLTAEAGRPLQFFFATRELLSETLHNARDVLFLAARQVRLVLERLSQTQKLQTATERLEETNRQLLEKSHLDPLTGLYNRTYLFQKLEDELLHLSRQPHPEAFPLAVLFIDLDHFNDFNDTFGHMVGDQILKETGRLLQNLVRSVDVAARFGGDEFVLLLPGTPQAGAVHVAERTISSFLEAESFRLQVSLP
ncbi:MAG: GGDEF domain-containing protein, partial [Spirochaetales bacterium]|nr:GGDEF domain-containing protein [Spirochaetales bacterium]